MTQIEFVTELEQALRGNVEERIIQENVRYYNDYISEQRAAGKSEEEIFASLGSPRLIAKTIIDTWSFSWMKETASQNWVTKTIAILAIVAVVFLVLSIIFKLVAILFKPAVVVLAVAAVYYLVKNSSNK